MDKAIIIENIARQLELVVEQNNNIKAYVGKIPQIDMDILKANIRKLYEQYCDLDKANFLVSVDKVRKEEIPSVIDEIKETIENPLIIVHEKCMIEENIISEDKPQTIVVEENTEVIFVPEPKVITKEKTIEIKEEVIATTLDNSIKETKTEAHIDLFGNAAPKSIADRYKDDAKLLHERIQKNKTDKNINSKMQYNAIKDLKSAIGINEKFLFINELFKGNMKEYNDSILKLNDFKTLTEIEYFLEELKEKHKWDDDMVAYLTLKDFVERKYL